ncbi:ERF family protein [Candidatus Pacearchaeota archaeon]|nr:ERF family protein [Candidatus Pacearchaeota archaeon]
MKITDKLLQARKLIKETSLKKEGKNQFSNYDYFTPTQVSHLVDTVCQELKMLPIFSLKKDEFGLYGSLALVDVDESDPSCKGIEIMMRTEMPSITATNRTQQMGGCETYTKRYMLMSLFDICDNNLDFDSQDNRAKAPMKVEKQAEKIAESMKPDDDIALNIRLSGTMQELQDVWEKMNKKEQKHYASLVTIRKKEISTK